MREIYFETNIIKLGLAFLLIVPVVMTNIPLAHASLEPLLFSEDANIIKFTHKLIYNSLYSRKESSLNENKDSKKDHKNFWIKMNTAGKHSDKTH